MFWINQPFPILGKRCSPVQRAGCAALHRLGPLGPCAENREANRALDGRPGWGDGEFSPVEHQKKLGFQYPFLSCEITYIRNCNGSMVTAETLLWKKP